ncbi:MAG: heavy-metal-associated domain-containing protein [Bacilli bacterium]|nr:heavy-metal-associated domain-containing protein [Bacilli bacterium]
MVKCEIQLEGMRCPMCEEHINNILRKVPLVKKVTSSHHTNKATVIAEDEVQEELLRKAIEEQGYHFLGFKKEPYEKKGLFSLFKKKK